MDRIRKALDLAREERARPFDVTVTPVRPVGEKSAPPPLAAIQYTKTRVFSPSAALLESNRIINSASSGEAATAFRMLRTQVLHRMEENRWRSLAVLSPSSDDGKTTTAI